MTLITSLWCYFYYVCVCGIGIARIPCKCVSIKSVGNFLVSVDTVATWRLKDVSFVVVFLGCLYSGS